MSAQPSGSYLLTEDLGEKVIKIRHLGLKTPEPDSQFIETIQDELANVLQGAIGADTPVMRLKMRDVADEVLGEIYELYGDNVLVVSTCPEIQQSVHGISIQINRLVDIYGNSLGLGPRPGHKDLHAQFVNIAALSKSRGQNTPVVLAEDGIFKGETMKYVVRGLQEVGVNIAGIVAGFNYSKAPVKEIEETLGVPVHVARELGPILDWVPDHDFLPFVPGCGKVLGVKLGKRLSPFYSSHQATFCMPYISPHSPVSEWATIPQDKVEDFSRRCRALACDLFGEIERLNPDMVPLTISDIIHSKQRVSIPIPLEIEGQEESYRFPETNSRITAVLSSNNPKL